MCFAAAAAVHEATTTPFLAVYLSALRLETACTHLAFHQEDSVAALLHTLIDVVLLLSSSFLLPVMPPFSALIFTLFLAGCSTFPTNLEPHDVAPANAVVGWYQKLFLTDRVFSDSFRFAC